MTRFLFYDGDCGICQKFAGVIRPLAQRGNVVLQPYQELTSEFKECYRLSDSRFEQGLYYLDTRTGKVRHGAFAIHAFFLQFTPAKYLVWLIYAVPILLLIEVILYHLVARHRTAISERLGLNICKVNPGDVNRRS